METVPAIPAAQSPALAVPGGVNKLAVALILSGYAKDLALPALMIVVSNSGIPGTRMCRCLVIIAPHFISIHFRKCACCLVYACQQSPPDRNIQF